MSAIKAKCRYCGTRVSYFGEICESCCETHNLSIINGEYHRNPKSEGSES